MTTLLYFHMKKTCPSLMQYDFLPRLDFGKLEEAQNVVLFNYVGVFPHLPVIAAILRFSTIMGITAWQHIRPSRGMGSFHINKLASNQHRRTNQASSSRC